MSADRGRYSKVSRRIWNSASFRILSQPKPSGAWLFLRVLTAPELNSIPGLFQAWDAGLAKALNWSAKDFDRCFAELTREGLARADWTVGLVWLPNAIAHNEPESPNVVIGWRTYWQELPECLLKLQAQASLMAWFEAKGEPWVKAFGKAISKTMPNQEQEHKQPDARGERQARVHKEDGSERSGKKRSADVILREADTKMYSVKKEKQ